jgi:hypothetical protein
VLHPGPPDRNEEYGKQRDTLGRGLVVQIVRDDADGDDEAKVEEELESGNSTL